MLLFLDTQLLNKCTHTETNVYVKPTNAGLLLQYKSHVDNRYKYGPLKTTLDHAFRLSSNSSSFSEECDHLKLLFSTLKYLEKLIGSTITRFIALKVSDQSVSSPTDTKVWDPFQLFFHLKTKLQLIFFRINLRIWIRRFTQTPSLCLCESQDWTRPRTVQSPATGCRPKMPRI